MPVYYSQMIMCNLPVKHVILFDGEWKFKNCFFLESYIYKPQKVKPSAKGWVKFEQF